MKRSWWQDIKILPVVSRAIFQALETVTTIWCSLSRHERILSQIGAFELVGHHCQTEIATTQMDLMARGGDLTLRAIITPTLMENRPSPPSLLTRGVLKTDSSQSGSHLEIPTRKELCSNAIISVDFICYDMTGNYWENPLPGSKWACKDVTN